MTQNYTRESKHLNERQKHKAFHKSNQKPPCNSTHTRCFSMFNQPLNVQMCCVMPNDQTNHTDDKKQLNIEVAKDLKRKKSLPLVNRIQTETAGTLGKVLNKRSHTLVYTRTQEKPEKPSFSKKQIKTLQISIFSQVKNVQCLQSM